MFATAVGQGLQDNRFAALGVRAMSHNSSNPFNSREVNSIYLESICYCGWR